MDADPHLKRGPARPRVCRYCPLARGRSENGILGTVEGDEERVALVVDLLTAVGCECFAEQPSVLGEDGYVLAAVGLEQLRRAFDIREQERCGGSRRLVHRNHHPARPDVLQVADGVDVAVRERAPKGPLIALPR
jgi:hypothetical protein